MDHKKFALQLVEFNKTAFDDTFYTVNTFQDNTTRLVSRFIDKISWLPENGKMSIYQYLLAYKNGRLDYWRLKNHKKRKSDNVVYWS
jgi:hypothetical protein